MKILKYIVVCISVITGIVISYAIGPHSNFDPYKPINEDYIQILIYQLYFTGIVSSTFGFAFAYLFKLNIKLTALIVLILGVIFATLTQISDPDFIENKVSAISEFMLPYSLTCLFIFLVTFGINKKWPRFD